VAIVHDIVKESGRVLPHPSATLHTYASADTLYRCISAYHFTTVLSLLLPCIIILFLHLLSTNHKYTQPCYFPLLYKPTAQNVKMVMKNSLMRSSRLCAAPVVVPVVL
jgi:hypothetical protein